MNAHLKSIFRLAICIALLSILLSAGAIPATAQDSKPPVPPEQIEDQSSPPNPFARRAPDGNWYMPAGIPSSQLPAQASPQSTGGPDDFGYNWDDSIPLNWIDTTNGSNTGLSGDSYDQATGPITIPFPFKYYENTYDEVYITAAGYLSFSEADYWDDQSRIPSPSEPNNVVAPYWTPFYIDSASWVHYLSGGSVPNRYFVVEWHDVVGDYDEDDTFRFEVILHENGDIDFQYQQMTYVGGYWCGVAGIEDESGLDGLTYVGYCDTAPSNKAVRFFRPPPSARVRVDPLYQGSFVIAGETVSYPFAIKNTGELGSDTFDLIPDFPDTQIWPWEFTSEEGDPLGDTNSNGFLDTGPVDQGSTVKVVLMVTAPDDTQIGENDQAIFDIRSSRATNKIKEISITTAIPAPFAQVFTDRSNWAMSLYLAQPTSQVVKKVTEDDHYGYGPVVAETPNGFAYFWYRYTDSGSEIEYTLLDHSGEKTREVDQLTHNTGLSTYTYDYEPAVDVTPNGRIGVVWYRIKYNEDYTLHNYNIYFAILDNQGNLIYGPTNLTKNDIWGSWDDLSAPELYAPRIAATTDNHFALAWQQYLYKSDGSLEDIFIAVRGPTGSEIKPITNFTNASPGGSESYYSPTLTTLVGNKVLLSYSQWEDYGFTGIVYTVLNSSGASVFPLTHLDDWVGSSLDAVQMPSGRVVIARTRWDQDLPRIVYSILDQDYQYFSWGPLVNSAAISGNSGVSTAEDQTSRTILTWADQDSSLRKHLYYALLGEDGWQMTQPMIFYTSSETVGISYSGYGNTSYSWTPPEGVDGFTEFKGDTFNAPPGGIAAVKVYASNYGTTQATNVTLTATLDSALTYLDDTSGITPTKNGNQLTWILPDMGLLDYLKFTLYVQLATGVEYGSLYPVTLSLATDGPEVDPDNNLDGAAVVAVRQVFMPITRNDYR